MTAAPISRKSKAITIVPLALLSGAWTVSLVGYSPAGAAGDNDHPLPDGTSVPQQAIEAPASVPVPGQLGPAVPAGSVDSVVAGASTSGIPAPALAAYQRAAQIIDSADKSCNVPWELIAAIGRVESDHGRYGGNVLTDDGVSKPGIYGPELNGKNNTQVISDTDAGELDNDPVFDRAVGPMQFIPSTWQVVKVDADGDGERNPQDIDDAALATAVYLCSGDDNLSQRAGQEAAVYRYNHSHEYVALVLRIMEAYAAGDYTAVPSGSYAGTLFTPDYATAIDHRRQAAKARARNGDTRTTPRRGGGDSTDGGTAPEAPASPGDPAPTPGTGPLPGGGDGGDGGSLGDASKAVGDAVSSAPAPVKSLATPLVHTLATTAEALDFCQAQFAAVPDPLGLLDRLADDCAARVTGKTPDQAASLIPNTLSGILDWLS